MNKKQKRFLSVLLCIVFVCTYFPSFADAVTLTATNDTILPLSEDTMPARFGGELYVPYDVFDHLNIESDYADGVLTLSSDEQYLSFSPSEGYAYDQNGSSYSTPAYDKNDTVYVPVKLCCSQFGLEYSSLSASGEAILRITNSSARSDSEFLSNNASQIQDLVNEYLGVPPVTPPPPPIPESNIPEPQAPAPEENTAPQTMPEEPEKDIPPIQETPTQKAGQVYLTFWGAPNSYTADILTTLQKTNHKATFFLPVDTQTWTDDPIRRIAAEGHSFGLLLEAAPHSDAADLERQLSEANEQLSFLTGQSTRIISNQNGCIVLSRTQQSQLLRAGYRFWDATIDGQDDAEKATAKYVYATAAQKLVETSNTMVLKLHHEPVTSEALDSICSYMLRQNISASQVVTSSTPVNYISEPR